MSELRTAAGQPCLMEFDRTNPEAVKWARTRAAQLVTEVTAETQKAIRHIIARAFREGIAPRESARLIRDVVGLRTDQTDSVLALRTRLLAAERKAARTGRPVRVPVPGGASSTVPPRGLGADRISAILKRQAQRQLRQRALLIARTETIAASNAGQQELWRQAVSSGLLRGNELQMWTVSFDERLCPVCRPLNGVTVPMGVPFQTSLGPVYAPPAHPNCRCAVVLSVPSPRSRR